ncbi:cilia- and flagella-associated protein 107-like isoform X1 [Macrotis lagotis]|uniref:cilia- and flagella-associated protein 107-like isoform X1 n=1 Tax=Macrotis lagotis TaxID=92651 RepID=UPI003D69839D
MFPMSPQSCSTPSWRIEPKFSTRVLIGNWVEERNKFIKTSKPSFHSTCQEDFIWFQDHKADQKTKWYNMRRSEGLPYKNLITHHEEPKHRNLISTYDDHFNRHGYNPLLPPIRTWNGQKLMWLPEKSDFPLLAPPTNYGLFENLQKKWQEPTKIDRATSIYTSSYVRHPVSAMSEQEGAIPALPPPPI